MTIKAEIPTVREVVGIFNNSEDLQSAIDELLSSGFHRAELSLLASEDAVTKQLGHRYQKISELADNAKVPRTAYVSTEALGDAEGAVMGALMYVGATAGAGAVLVSGGTIAVGIAAVALGGSAGGLVGSILAKWIGGQHAQHLQEQIDHGGLILWVRTWDDDEEARAIEILLRHSGRDVHPHTLRAAA